MSNIKLTIDAADFDAWFEWFNEFVIEGECTDADEFSGSLEFLAPDLNTVIARVDLLHVGIISLSPAPETGSEGIARFELELYVEEVAFEYTAQ